MKIPEETITRKYAQTFATLKPGRFTKKEKVGDIFFFPSDKGTIPGIQESNDSGVLRKTWAKQMNCTVSELYCNTTIEIII